MTTTSLLVNESILNSVSLLRMQEQSGYLKSPSSNDALFDHRSAMAGWWLSLLEILDYPAEIAEIAMSYSDRFLSSTKTSIKPRTFRLLCVTCIYTAIKVHGYACVPPSSFAQLCQYEYTVKQIEDMESKLLRALKWRMNPPTGRSYLRLFVELLPVTSEDDKQVVLELADHQVIHSMQNEKWMSTASYAVAYCAFINALNTMEIDSTVVSSLQRSLRHSLNMECCQEQEIKNDLLQELVLDSSSSSKSVKVFLSSNDDKLIDMESKAPERSTSSSPRSVLYQES